MRAEVHDPRVCHLGEGPLWHPLRGELFWFDIFGQRLLADDGRAWAFDVLASAAGWVDRTRLLIATERDLRLFDVETGASETVAALEADNPATRSNDGRADPYGGFWIGTMGKGGEPEAGAIYRFYRGEVRQLYPDITIPNAICFPPGGGSAYLADTHRHLVWRVALDAEGWPAGERAVFLDHLAEGVNPDGAVVDTEGRMWCAEWGAARVRCYGPDGRVLHTVEIPAAQPTCPALTPEGRLFVTSATAGMPSEKAATDPHAGKTYAARVPATGQPEHKVIL